MPYRWPNELLRSGRVRQQREAALNVLSAALEAVDPATAIQRHVAVVGDTLRVGSRSHNLQEVERLLVVGAGKASGAMAAAVENLLGERVIEGLVIVPHGTAAATRRIRLCQASHPVPDASSVACAGRVADLLQDATGRDLVLCLISGGGSALMALPHDGLALDDFERLTQALLRSGATINEMNAVRKHLDAVKGGGLARLAQPAGVVSLILSDVVGNPLDTIASGPTAADSSTYADAAEVIERYDLWQTIPQSVADRLRRGRAGELPETPKPGDPLFERVDNLVVGSNEVAALAAVAEAERRGLHGLLLTTYVEGEAREVGKVFGGLARELAAAGRPLPRPACVVAGGETTVTVRGQGKGGRNQELALGAALKLDGLPDVVVISAATDGVDGPTDAAGAIVDGTSLARARQLGIEPNAALADNDVYSFFERLGDVLRTGPTGTNVNDLVLVFAF